MKDRVYKETKNMKSREIFEYVQDKCRKFTVDRKKHAVLLSR